MTNGQMAGVIELLIAVLAIVMIAWVVIKRGVRLDTKPNQFSANYLLATKIAIGAILVKGIIDIVTGASIFWIVIEFGLVLWGILWLRKK